MANNIDVTTELAKIMEAVYGEEVRGSIHSAIKKMADIINTNLITVDDTFTVEGAAADAKKVGDVTLRFLGDLAANSDLNNIKSSGIYRLRNNNNYVNLPYDDFGTGFLIVYAVGTTGYSILQEIFETGTNNKNYGIYTRTCKTSSTPHTWGYWTSSIVKTDTTLSQPGMPADAKTVGDTTLRMMGVLEDGANFNNIITTGIYRISSNKEYRNSPLTDTTTGWLVVYQYGATGMSCTQHVIESGTREGKTYFTYMRSANTTASPYTWGAWQTSTIETDTSLSKSGEAADAKTVGDRFLDLEFEPIDITSFSISPNIAEIGAIIGSISLTYRINKIPNELKLDNVTITPRSSGTETKSSLSLNRTTTFTLDASDNGSPSKAATTDRATATITFTNKVYWGVAAQPTAINSSFVNGLTSNVLSTTRARTFTVTAGVNQYIWYCSPASYMECKFKVGGFDGGFTRVATISHTNQSGHNESYYIYRSDNPSLGSTTVEVS